jgi:predicted nucleic acid-binding protein
LLTEVAGAIARRTGKPELAHQAVKRLLNIPSLRLVASDQQLGTAAARLAADLRLRGADAMYVAVAYRLNIPLVTWDREQLERTQNFIVAYTPEDDEMFLTWR